MANVSTLVNVVLRLMDMFGLVKSRKLSLNALTVANGLVMSIWKRR